MKKWFFRLNNDIFTICNNVKDVGGSNKSVPIYLSIF